MIIIKRREEIGKHVFTVFHFQSYIEKRKQGYIAYFRGTDLIVRKREQPAEHATIQSTGANYEESTASGSRWDDGKAAQPTVEKQPRKNQHRQAKGNQTR